MPRLLWKSQADSSHSNFTLDGTTRGNTPINPSSQIGDSRSPSVVGITPIRRRSHTLEGNTVGLKQTEEQLLFSDDITGVNSPTARDQNTNIIHSSNSLHNVLRSRKESEVKNGFEVDVDNDILILAAQRDLQKDSSRFVRGMMPAVIRKNVSTPTFSQANVAAESNAKPTSPISLELPTTKPRTSEPRRNVTSNAQSESPFNSSPLDIMHQSIKRQTLKGLKTNAKETNNQFLQAKIATLGITTPDDFRIIRTPNALLSRPDREKNKNSFASSKNIGSHEDVQILNLQGFMGQDADPRSNESIPHVRTSRHKARLDTHHDVTKSIAGRVSRHTGKAQPKRRRSKHKSRALLDKELDNDEAILKDIDDLDKNIEGFLIQPKNTVKDHGGRPITLEEAVDLRLMLTGNPGSALPKEWLQQSFAQNKNLSLPYGIVQRKGGPCGVLASVQAFMMKNLIFGSWLTPNITPASPLRPSQMEWSWALATALTEILWQAKDTKVILALPGSFPHFMSYGATRFQPDGLTECVKLLEFSSAMSLYDAIQKYLSAFANGSSSGCVLFLYSALLSRGLNKLKSDMDANSQLISVHGYASQEVVNLLITGQATTNAFNGDQILGDEGLTSLSSRSEGPFLPSDKDLSSSRLIFKGIQNKSQIGLLSLFEHYGSYKIGSYLKNPEFPIWVVCSESHYSVLFSRELAIAGNHPPMSAFDVYFYDGLAMLDEEIRLTIDATSELTIAEPVPPLELCIRTKWPRASVSWNGIDPIL